MKRDTAIVAAVCALPALLVIACRYPPFVDFPQHAAVASILQHLHDPAYDFGQHYELALGRTLYWLPYGLTWVLGHVVDAELAVRVVVGISASAVPLGVLAILRATERPAYLALLALPLAFNHALFFGFHHFLLATGLALGTYALLVAPAWSRARAVAMAALAIASTLTHVYGIALLFAMACAHAALGDRARLRARALLLVPAVAGAALWAVLGAAAPGYGERVSPGALERIRELPGSILGDYGDRTDTLQLVLVVVATIAAAWSDPRTWSTPRKVAALCALGNLVLYFVLPQHTATAKYIHFRHAILAALFLPLLAQGLPRYKHLASAALAAFALLVAALHFLAFQSEASSFDAIADAVPRNAKVVGLVVDPTSDALDGPVYLHFPAYLQARSGGLPAMSFPRVFWNLPVAMRDDAGVPPTPMDFEWNANLYDERRFGYFYDWAVVRVPDDTEVATSPRFPFRLQLRSGRWQLYRRVAP